MDQISLNGKVYEIQCEPDIPVPHDMITLLETPIDDTVITHSSACWRRYLAHWAVNDGYLYLSNIEGIYEKKCQEPIRADWFSGEICAIDGELLDYVHLGYASTYEFEHKLRFENGQLVDQQLIDNRGKTNFDPEPTEEAAQAFKVLLDEMIAGLNKDLKKR